MSTTMTDTEINRRADENHFAMYRLFATTGDGEARERGGLGLVASGVPIAMFNQAFVLRPLDDPHALMGDAMRFFDEKQLPFVVRIPAGLDLAAERACDDLGMPYSDAVPGMVLTDLTRTYRTAEGLDIQVVRDAATLRDHLLIDAECFGLPLDIGERMFTPKLIDATDTTAYVGYVDGLPVATSGVVITGRTTGVYNIATRASHRGRGIGEAMTARAIARGVELGATFASLQASEMGKPVYERMGFRVVREYRTFHRPGV
jgi:ribosomal protein S18 acetylase RimI-like enzyme